MSTKDDEYDYLFKGKRIIPFYIQINALIYVNLLKMYNNDMSSMSEVNYPK